MVGRVQSDFAARTDPWPKPWCLVEACPPPGLAMIKVVAVFALLPAAASLKAGIIGGGLGGLTAANALRKIGIDAQVYERAAKLWPSKRMDAGDDGCNVRKGGAVCCEVSAVDSHLNCDFCG